MSNKPKPEAEAEADAPATATAAGDGGTATAPPKTKAAAQAVVDAVTPGPKTKEAVSNATAKTGEAIKNGTAKTGQAIKSGTQVCTKAAKDVTAGGKAVMARAMNTDGLTEDGKRAHKLFMRTLILGGGFFFIGLPLLAAFT